MLKHFMKKWQQYKYRFVPWIALNLKDRSVRSVEKGSQDEIISSAEAQSALLSFFSSLETIHPENSDSILKYKENLAIMKKCMGFVTERKSSQLSGGGQGVFVTQGKVPPETVVSIYPGVIYEKYEPIFFQSLGNQFIFRCIDGVLIDGNDKNLSKLIFKSCHGRDRMGPYLTCDRTWLSPFPLNPLAVGQYVNNQSKKYPANVAYQEFDIPPDFPLKLRKYIPNVHYSASTEHTGQRLTRVVVLVSTREISCGEELFSTYFTVVH